MPNHIDSIIHLAIKEKRHSRKCGGKKIREITLHDFPLGVDKISTLSALIGNTTVANLLDIWIG